MSLTNEQRETLNDRLGETFDSLKIASEQRKSVRTYLELIDQRDDETWGHSMRVGLLGVDMSRFTHTYEPNAYLYTGLLHDVGKALTNPVSLKKKEGFGPKDMAELKKHVADGMRILRGIHSFSAEALGWHHYFSGGYPSKRERPDVGVDFCEATRLKAMYVGRITGLSDFYDAVTNRENDKFSPGVKRLPTSDEAKGILLKANRDVEFLINELYDAGVFGRPRQ
jgi:hypothetical protein